MAKKTVITCDICGSSDAKRHSFLCDRVADGAGGMENVYYDVDLCTMHFTELVRKHEHPSKYRDRVVGRSRRMAYGRGVKDWAELQKGIWKKMTTAERELALAIEAYKFERK